MNCETFETLITDLARQHTGEGNAHEAALDHVKSCARCAARLAGERALTGLLARAAAEPCRAPSQVETALLAAYRARKVKLPGEADHNRPPRVLPAVAWGIAAVLVLGLLGATAFKLFHFPTTGGSSLAGPATEKLSPAHPAQTGSQAEGAAAAPEMFPDEKTPRTELVARRVGPRRAAPPKKPTPVEIATDFIPLTPDAGLAAVESGQLVRVLLPRSAMAACGLPVNQERADQPVAAQVLIGQDGVARAIRFLSQTNSNFVQTGLPSKR